LDPCFITRVNLLAGKIMLNVVVCDAKPFKRVLNGREPYYESTEDWSSAADCENCARVENLCQGEIEKSTGLLCGYISRVEKATQFPPSRY
jgi:hypothetical protein